MNNFDLKKYLSEGKLIKEEKFNGAIIRKGSSDKSKEDTKIVRQALKDKGIKFTNRGEFGMDFKDADLAQIKKVIAGAKVGEFIISRDVNENKLLTEDQFTSPELQKAADGLSTAVIALRKASVAKEMYKGNDDWSAFEKAYSVLIQDLKSKEVRS